MDRDSSVGTATRYALDGPGIEPPWRQDLPHPSRTIILPVVLYGCETWSLTLREERRLRVFENRVFRRVFGPKRDEVTGEWRKLLN